MARITVPIRPDFFHAAGAAHGVVYFKVLDDACFFAVNSLVRDVFVLTTSFNLYLTRPVTAGQLVATGTVAHASRRLFVAEARAEDSEGRQAATGSGTFVPSTIALGPDVGYA